MPKRKGFTFWVSDKGCHICTSHALRNGVGYPTTCYKGKTITVVRFLWLMSGKELPEGMVTRHTCDDPLCINLQHIVLGTPLQNNQDKIDRGRTARGISSGMCKLTEAQVREIAFDKTQSARDLAEKFGVNRITINYIRAGKTWRDVTGFEETHRGVLKGEAHGMCKITKEQALEIVAHPEVSAKEFSDRYGITKESIYGIRKGVTWSSVTGIQKYIRRKG